MPRAAQSAAAANDDLPSGLTSDEARHRLEKFGPNAMPDRALHSLRAALEKFWAPVPWMLEAAIVLELVLGKYVEAAIIAALLVFNAALGLFQENRAQATLAALKSRLALNASVRRDGAWKTIPLAEPRLAAEGMTKISSKDFRDGNTCAARANFRAFRPYIHSTIYTEGRVKRDRSKILQLLFW